VSEFSRKSAAPSGRASTCKECTSQYFRDWYAANGDRVRERARAAAIANPERNRERVNAWHSANPERHQQQARESKHRRRAIEKGTSTGAIDERRIWEEQAGICALCDQPIDRELKHPDPFSKSLDHIIPLAKGGSHTQDNVQWTHLRCNLSKGASVPQ
jgi:5-methylcytosine-specific restriction endonuclease McrA